MNRVYPLLLFALGLAMLFIMFFMSGVFGIFYDTALASFLLLIVLCIPLFFENIKWYEPVFAVNAMFFLFGISGVYLAYTGFSTAEHAVHDFSDLARRAPLIILYVVTWILCFYIGYLFLRKDPVELANNDSLVPPVKENQAVAMRIFSALCFIVAFFNLAYNIWIFSPDSPIAYFTSFGVSRYREQVNEGIYTTLGYNLFIVGFIFYRHSFLNWSWRRIVSFSVLLVLSLAAFLSRGQIFFTFSIVLFLLVLEYFFSRNRKAYFYWIMGILPILCVVVVSSYFFRLVSVEFFLAEKAGNDLDIIQSFFSKISGFGALIFGKGNVPNLPAMLVYEDHFGNIESYLSGKSLVSWLSAFIPYFDATYIGYGISDTWYPNNVGGIPPGVVHELLANFGFLGGLLSAIVLGAIAACLFNIFYEKRGFLLCVMYSALLVRFWFILPKVEFAVLSNAIWLFLPASAVFLFFLGFSRVFLDRPMLQKNKL